MPKGRKKVLAENEVSDIIESLQLDDTLTKFDICFQFKVSRSALYTYLPPYLKDPKYNPKKKAKDPIHPIPKTDG